MLHKRGNPDLCQDFHCQLQHILSSGQTTTQMLWRRRRRRRSSGLLWSSLLFWLGLSSHCVVTRETGTASRHWGHWLAATWHRSHMVRDRKRRRWAEKGASCTEKTKKRVKSVDEVIVVFSNVFSLTLCSHVFFFSPVLLMHLLHSLALQLQPPLPDQTSIQTSSIHPCVPPSSLPPF